MHLVSVFHFKLSLSFLLCRNIVMIITNAIPLEELENCSYDFMPAGHAMKIHGLGIEWLLSEVVFFLSP